MPKASWMTEVPGLDRKTASGSTMGTPQIDIKSASKNMMVTNRAEKGPMAGKNATLIWSSEVYTLEPKETMLVPSEVIFGIFGNPFIARSRQEKDDIATRFGGYQCPPFPKGKTIQHMNQVQLTPIGPPLYFPDIIVQMVDNKSKKFDSAVAIYDTFMEGLYFADPEEIGSFS